MLNPFKQLGEINKMRQEAMRIQKELQNEEVVVDKNGVHIVISGDQKIKELASNGQSDNDVKDAINEAVKKSQEVAARKLSQMQGGLSGLLGGMGGQ